jgi:hypothetical protein
VLRNQGYRLSSVFGLNDLGAQGRLNVGLLIQDITRCFEEKTEIAFIPARLVPENFPDVDDLSLRYAVYKREV